MRAGIRRPPVSGHKVRTSLPGGSCRQGLPLISGVPTGGAQKSRIPGGIRSGIPAPGPAWSRKTPLAEGRATRDDAVIKKDGRNTPESFQGDGVRDEASPPWGRPQRYRHHVSATTHPIPVRARGSESPTGAHLGRGRASAVRPRAEATSATGRLGNKAVRVDLGAGRGPRARRSGRGDSVAALVGRDGVRRARRHGIVGPPPGARLRMPVKCTVTARRARSASRDATASYTSRCWAATSGADSPIGGRSAASRS